MMSKEKKIGSIQKILLSVFVSIIFCGFLYQAVKPAIKDSGIFERNWKNIYQPVTQVKGYDPEGTNVKYRLIKVFPKHDFKIDSLTGMVYINNANIKSNEYHVIVSVIDETGKYTIKDFYLKDVKYKE